MPNQLIYIMVEVGNPMHAACHIWSNGRWMLPNTSHDDLLSVEKERPDEVKYLGDISEIDHPVIAKTVTRWQSFVYELTEEAYKACTEKWEARRLASSDP